MTPPTALSLLPAATNPDASEGLACWEGEDNVELVNGEREIFCQRLDAASGAELADDFRLTDMGPDGADFLFWDSLECGDTSAWSSSSP